MTYDEIIKLVQKFSQDVSCEIGKGHIKFAEMFAWRFAMWLKKDYCIVPKVVIKTDYDYNAYMSAQFSGRNTKNCNKIAQWHQGKCDELISLFGKDLFNEEKE